MAEEIRCPVDGCAWKFRLEPPNVDMLALASVFGIGVMASTAASQYAQHVERVLEEHYKGHSVADYLSTIMRLRREGGF